MRSKRVCYFINLARGDQAKRNGINGTCVGKGVYAGNSLTDLSRGLVSQLTLHYDFESSTLNGHDDAENFTRGLIDHGRPLRMLQSDYIEADGERITHYYLCHYKPWSAGFDRLSRSLIRFKNGSQIDLRAWTSCVIENLPSTLSAQPVIVRALSSNETDIVSNHCALDHVGEKLAKHMHGYYLPTLLSKRTITPPAKTLSRSGREEVFNDLYVFDGTDFAATHILILDDIVTTGFTLRAIIRSIRKTYSTLAITTLTLASTDANSRLNDGIDLRSGEYHWKDHQGWSIVEEELPATVAVQKLKESIQCNFMDVE